MLGHPRSDEPVRMSEAVVIDVPPGGPDLTKFWWAPLTAGVLTMLCGLVALVYPEPTVKVIGFVFGIYLILWGFVILLRALLEPDAPGAVARMLIALLGVVSIVVGFVVMTRPGESVLTLASILGFWWFAAGVVHVARGIAHAEGRGLNIFEGVIGIAGGII